MADELLAEATAALVVAETPPPPAPPNTAASLFKKKKKKPLGRTLEAPVTLVKSTVKSASQPSASAAAVSYGASARRAADVSAQNNCSLEALGVALSRCGSVRAALAGKNAVARQLDEVLEGVDRNECPSRACEALRQALGGGGDGAAAKNLAAAFAYADAVEVFGLLLERSELSALVESRGAASLQPCLLCGHHQQSCSSFCETCPVLAAVPLLSNTEPLHAAIREMRREQPRGCSSCGERAVAVNHTLDSCADLLAVNVAWATRPAATEVAALLHRLDSPLDARAAFSDDEEAEKELRYLVAIVCFRGDHYTAFKRTTEPSSLDDDDYAVFWTYHDRFVERASGDFDSLVKLAIDPERPPLQPCLAFYARRKH